VQIEISSQEALETAIGALGRGELNHAEHILGALLQSDPNCLEARLLAVQLCHEGDRFEDALFHLLEACRTKPTVLSLDRYIEVLKAVQTPNMGEYWLELIRMALTAYPQHPTLLQEFLSFLDEGIVEFARFMELARQIEAQGSNNDPGSLLRILRRRKLELLIKENSDKRRTSGERIYYVADVNHTTRCELLERLSAIVMCRDLGEIPRGEIVMMSPDNSFADLLKCSPFGEDIPVLSQEEEWERLFLTSDAIDGYTLCLSQGGGDAQLDTQLWIANVRLRFGSAYQESSQRYRTLQNTLSSTFNMPPNSPLVCVYATEYRIPFFGRNLGAHPIYGSSLHDVRLAIEDLLNRGFWVALMSPSGDECKAIRHPNFIQLHEMTSTTSNESMRGVRKALHICACASIAQSTEGWGIACYGATPRVILNWLPGLTLPNTNDRVLPALFWHTKELRFLSTMEIEILLNTLRPFNVDNLDGLVAAKDLAIMSVAPHDIVSAIVEERRDKSSDQHDELSCQFVSPSFRARFPRLFDDLTEH